MISSRRFRQALVLILIAAGCTSSPRFVTRSGQPSRASSGQPPARSPRSSPTTADKALLILEGIASYYADAFHGKQAANGEIFDMNDLTAAHRTLPFGTKVRVTNLSNQKSVVVRIIDRGPYVEGRIIDLSLGAAKVVDMIGSGTARVRIDVVEWGKGQLYH